jgi:hypothetical protein
MHKFLFGVVAMIGLGVALAPSEVRAASVCNGTVTGTISGGLVVHPGDNCNVVSASVSGGIHMDGGTLRVCGSTVTGGVIVAVTGANSALATVTLGNLELGCTGDSISGGVNISGVTGSTPGDEFNDSVELEHDTITGGLTLKNNGVVEVESNHVTGGCTASGNAFITNIANFLGPNVYSGGNNGCPG